MDHSGAEQEWPKNDWPATPPESPGSRSRRMVIVVVAVALVCLGATGYGLLKVRDAVVSVTSPLTTTSTRPQLPRTSQPSATPASPSGPRASDYPVRTKEDVGRVCDGWFYPQSPKLSGVAPHPIVVSERREKLFPSRFHPAYVDLPDDVSQSRQAAWQPENAALAQLVACVDLVESGNSLGDCKFDDPSPTTAPMVEGIYQVTVYEVATRREIFQTRVTGASTCPLVVLLTGDRTIHSEVTGRQLYEKLHDYVEK
jgi:hypothetical protein